MKDFIKTFKQLQLEAYNTAVEKGWWNKPKSTGENIALMHSELSEALEAYRKGNPQSKKIPDYTEIEEELADVIIRIMDFAGYKRWLNIPGAILAKMQYNKTRSYKHGGKKI